MRLPLSLLWLRALLPGSWGHSIPSSVPGPGVLVPTVSLSLLSSHWPCRPPSPGCRPPEPDNTNLKAEGLAGKGRQRRWGLPLRSHRQPSLMGQASVVATICPTCLGSDCLSLFHHNAASFLRPRFLEEVDNCGCPGPVSPSCTLAIGSSDRSQEDPGLLQPCS